MAATDPNWVPKLAAVIDGEWTEAMLADKTIEIVALIKAAQSPILAVVSHLGLYLTSDSDARRARATALLAQVVKQVPEAACSEQDVHHLSEFFTARLSDWPAIRGALHGSDALLRRQPPLAPLAEADAVALAGTFVQHVFVRSLGAADRMAALSTLGCALERHGQALLDGGLDLMEFCIASVDGEKDPRCLLEGFAAVHALLDLYQRQPPSTLHAGRLEASADELFDVLSCYFPVTFTPPPNDPHRITRGQIAAALESTLAACPAFAPHAVPLLMEKLSSTLRQAKLDALSALGACAEGYGRAPMADHVGTIWAALRQEVMAPAGEGLVEAEVAGAEEVAAAAAACLTRCIKAFQQDGGSALADTALEGAGMEDLLRCVSSPGEDAPTFRRSLARIKAVAALLCAMCHAGGTASGKAASRALPLLLDIAEQPLSIASRCLAWTVMLEILRALGGRPLRSAPASRELCQRLALCASRIDLPAKEGSQEAAQEAAAELWISKNDAATPALAASAQLAALGALLSCRPVAEQLEDADIAGALRVLLAVVTAPMGGILSFMETKATAALCVMANGPHAAALEQQGLPALLLAATQVGGRRASALAALQELSASNGRLHAEIVPALDQALQLNLPGALGSGGGQAALVVDLLRAAAVIGASAAAGDQQPRRQMMQLAQHLLDAVLLLEPQPPAAEAPVELLDAAALAVFTAAAAAEAEQQARVGAAAAEALLQLLERPASAVRGLQATVYSAALAPLQPRVAAELLAQQPFDLIGFLLKAALHDATAARPLSLAAASLLNKTPSAGADTAAQELMQTVLLPATAEGGDVAPRAWAAVSLVGRAMAMRSSSSVPRLVSDLTVMLTDPAAALQLPQAARCFASLLQEDDALHAVALNKRCHAVVKPLWQQRLYTFSIAALTAALKSAAAGPGADEMEVGGADASLHTQTDGAAAALLLGAAHLLSAAPAAVLKTDLPRALPLTLRCLVALQDEAQPGACSPLLASLVGSLEEALRCEQGRREAQEMLHSMLPVLVDLTAHRPAMAVREGALHCLLLLSELPYMALHPYRKAVTKAAAAAADDNKRRVRLQAAKCRQAWSAA